MDDFIKWVVEHISEITTTISLILTIVAFIIGKYGKNKTATQVSKDMSAIAKVVKKFPEFIRTAEKISDDPDVKRNYVLNMAYISCKAEGVILTEEQLADMGESIDDQVALSKDINVNSKTTVKADSVEIQEEIIEYEKYQ